jgi:26S proteasome regulatory subunit N5
MCWICFVKLADAWMAFELVSETHVWRIKLHRTTNIFGNYRDFE